MLECLHYSPQSQLDLDEIYDFFAIERDNPELGARIVADILMAVKDIPDHPDRFPPVGPLPLTQDFYRFVRVGAYLVFFRAEGESIYIDRVLNKSRDFAALLGCRSTEEDK